MEFVAVALYAIMIVATIGVIAGVPLFFGLLAYDVIESRKVAPVGEKEARRRVTVERGTARAFVIAGGVFWSLASLAGLYSFQQTGTTGVLLAAVMPLLACAATLVVGWYYERVTSVMLLLASIAVVAWGVIYQFDAGVWALVTLALIGPMLTASTLFWLARTDQDAYEIATEAPLQLSPMFAARSAFARAA